MKKLEQKKKEVNDILLKMQSGKSCIGEAANELVELMNYSSAKLLDGLAEKILYGSNCNSELLNVILDKFKQDNDLLPKNVSGWYLSHSFNSWCAYYNVEKQIIYGIDVDGTWFKRNIIDNEIDSDDYPATQRQVEERLFPFFEKMGYKSKRSKCLTGLTEFIDLGKSSFITYVADANYVFMGQDDRTQMNCIMKDGILAEIIEDEPQIETISKHELELMYQKIQNIADEIKNRL